MGTWKNKQWKYPKRFLYKGCGLVVWKWCMIRFPLWTVYLGNWSFGYDIFHNGHGFKIHFPPIIIINLCVKGKIVWTYKKGLLRIRINKWQFEY